MDSSPSNRGVPYLPLPFDPAVEASLPAMLRLFPSSITPEMIEGIRAANSSATSTVSAYVGDEPVDAKDWIVPAFSGGPEVALTSYASPGIGRAAACIYFVHGGGMISGNRFSDNIGLLNLVCDLKVVAVSVEYRLAPENPHPAPVEDCYRGLLWMHEHAGEIGIDQRRIVIAGESAGGGLAASVAIMARDRGGPTLIGQLLAAPMLDDRSDSPSAWQMQGRGLWDRTSNMTGWSALLGAERGSVGLSPYAAAARETRYAGLPQAFIDVGSAETFRDECVTYASSLWLAGVQAELHVWAGGCHGYDSLAPTADISVYTRRVRRQWLNRVIGV